MAMKNQRDLSPIPKESEPSLNCCTGSHLLIRCYTLPELESMADYSLPYKQRATDM
jgi:hypothetical protein